MLGAAYRFSAVLEQIVTHDYHPESDLRDDPRRLPIIVWQRPEFWPTDIDEPSS